MTGSVAHFDNPEESLRYMIQNLPLLVSLDLSGTDLAKVHHKPVEHRLAPVGKGAGDMASR